jgi:hypothetical protein
MEPSLRRPASSSRREDHGYGGLPASDHANLPITVLDLDPSHLGVSFEEEEESPFGVQSTPPPDQWIGTPEGRQEAGHGRGLGKEEEVGPQRRKLRFDRTGEGRRPQFEVALRSTPSALTRHLDSPKGGCIEQSQGPEQHPGEVEARESAPASLHRTCEVFANIVR